MCIVFQQLIELLFSVESPDTADSVGAHQVFALYLKKNRFHKN